MRVTARSLIHSTALFVPSICGILFAAQSAALAEPKRASYWNVDEVRAGMRGVGRTVMHGTKIEPFDAEVLGVLKNISPGRDMILCRLSGLNLDKTGVIAGMSGSPIYIDGKLLGAVAYAWAFGKEPIAGVTPFSQMHSFVAAYEDRDRAEQRQPARLGLGQPVYIGGRSFDSVTISQGFDDPSPTSEDGLWMVPLRTPLAASGFTAHSLSLLKDRCRSAGLVPMQGGAAPAAIAEQERNTPLQPGGPLAVAMILGDFDLSGIGTVTHIEGDRVYGWGHPYNGFGASEYPLMTGYIHTIYPRQSVSFKMGSPLRTVGVINADVSTGIAGWLGRKPDLIPVKMTVRCDPGESARTFNVQVVRQRHLLSSLVYTALTNSVDMQGELPEELTAELDCRIEVDGHAPLTIKDTYSGSSYSGGRAPQALYSQISSIISMLAYNSYKPIRINRIECDTTIHTGRRTAEIEAVELDSDTYAPGETLKTTVFLRPYKGPRQRVPLSLKLPADLADGTYTATICDEPTCARLELRDNPSLSNPHDLDQVFETLRVLMAPRRTRLAVHVPINAVGVVLDGKPLPNLPPSMVQILASSRRTGAQAMGGSVVAKHDSSFVIQGSETVRFTVSRNKKSIE